MAQSAGLHESADLLRAETVDRHRANVSLQEELEAVDWYDQRVDATEDPELASILAHNRDEEKEHAAMTLEWLRRHDPVLDQNLRTYLFSTGAVTEVQGAATAGESSPGGASSGGARSAGNDGSLGIGSLKGAAQ